MIGIDLRLADIEADLSTDAGRRKAIDEATQRCEGRLDALVLCAGLGPHVEPASRIVSVNYFGAVDMLDAMLPCLKRGAQPAVVLVSSVVSAMLPWDQNPLAAALAGGDEAQAHAIVAAAGPQAGALAYAASKNAATVAMRQRVQAWGAAGVRLNSVAPGSTQTPLLQGGLDDPRFGEAIRNFAVPLGRMASPQEIASVIAFLLGRDAAYVHGTQVFVDGGNDALARPTQF